MTNGGGATTRARLKLIRFATAGSLLIAGFLPRTNYYDPGSHPQTRCQHDDGAPEPAGGGALSEPFPRERGRGALGERAGAAWGAGQRLTVDAVYAYACDPLP